MRATDKAIQPVNEDQVSLLARILAGTKKWLERDGLAILLFAIATVIMSYPLVLKLGGDWIAMHDTDTYVKLWDNWWLQNYAFDERSLSFTARQFHPIGLDLSFHSISWSVAFLSWGLALITDAVTAYNITILIALFSTAYAAYLLVVPFSRFRAAAWLAGAIYTFAPYHLAHTGGHPDLVYLAPIPIAVLLLYNAITKPSLLAGIGAAFMIGLAAYTSLYIMVFTLLTIGPVFIFLLLDKGRWKQRNIWPIVGVFLLFSILLLLGRLYPIFRSASALTEAIELKYTADNDQADLLSFFLPSRLNPLFAPFTNEIASQFNRISFKWPAYLGLVPLILSIMALTWKRHRKFIWLWFFIGVLFVVLSLGPELRFNGRVYENVVMPARLLTWFQPMRAVGRPSFYVLGVLLPLAVLSGLGFDRLLIALGPRRKVQFTLMVIIPVLLMLEYWSGEYPGVSSGVNPFYKQLAQESGDFGIIQLPMGRLKSKRYLYLQTIHEKRIVEGLSARTSSEAYQYINSNPLLASWFFSEPLNCSIQAQRQIRAAIDELITDDYRYVIVHHNESTIPEPYNGYFASDPVYQDGDLTAFGVSDLANDLPCPDLTERVMDLPTVEYSTDIRWQHQIGLLGYDLSDSGEDTGQLSIRIFWQALIEMEQSLIAYFHLIDPETGTLVAQEDVIPRGWSYPTNWWTAGEVVEDTVRIPLQDVPAGRYELRIGWYDEDTGARLLPESEQFQIVEGDSVIVTIIEW